MAPAELVEAARSLVPDDRAIAITEGGATRQESVSNGLALVQTDAVVVHDAARPFVTAELIRSVIDALGDADAVVAAVPVDETLKRTSVDGNSMSVAETVDRSRLWRAQTPAVFRTEKLKESHRRARSDAFTGTDESQLIERYGGVVKVVIGTRANLKITFPEDFAVAEAMMRARD